MMGYHEQDTKFQAPEAPEVDEPDVTVVSTPTAATGWSPAAEHFAGKGYSVKGGEPAQSRVLNEVGARAWLKERYNGADFVDDWDDDLCLTVAASLQDAPVCGSEA